MHLVYSVASSFAMVSSAFNVSMLFSRFFHIFLSAASTSHAIIGGTSQWPIQGGARAPLLKIPKMKKRVPPVEN